ncbi:MAG: enoyl-CoA hydratase-related protein, partial [Rhodospirillaceae bacterium]
MTDPILDIEHDDGVATLTMNRPDKRNAMSDALLNAIDAFFATPPDGVKAVVLAGTGGHYCAG